MWTLLIGLVCETAHLRSVGHIPSLEIRVFGLEELPQKHLYQSRAYCSMAEVLHRLVDDGNTVIVIEHNLDVIAEADYILDIGPEAGDAGGEVVASGPPAKLSQHKESRTAPFIRKILSTRKKRLGVSPPRGVGVSA